MIDITQQGLHELIHLNQQTGELVWKERSEKWFDDTKERSASWRAKNWNAIYAGKRALDSQTKSGHKRGTLLKKNQLAHQIIWFMVHGFWADNIDHIDGNPANNSIDNLRAVCHKENLRNMKRRKNNSSGHNGVHFNREKQKWMAYIHIDGKFKHLGYYDTIELAKEARSIADLEYGFHPNHGRD